MHLRLPIAILLTEHVYWTKWRVFGILMLVVHIWSQSSVDPPPPPPPPTLLPLSPLDLLLLLLIFPSSSPLLLLLLIEEPPNWRTRSYCTLTHSSSPQLPGVRWPRSPLVRPPCRFLHDAGLWRPGVHRHTLQRLVHGDGNRRARPLWRSQVQHDGGEWNGGKK